MVRGPTSSSSNVERGAEILLKLGEASHDGMTLAELAERLEETKPAVHRALASLSKTGFVEQEGRRGRYRLGPAIYALAMVPYSTRSLVERMRPALVECSRRTGGSTFLLARSGLDAVCLDTEEGKYIIPSTVGGVGGRQPLGRGAASVCILGMLDDVTRSAILKANRDRLEGTNIDSVEQRIDFFIKNQYAINAPDSTRSSLNIAVGVPELKVKTLAAISVILPEYLVDEADDIVLALKDIVSKLNM